MMFCAFIACNPQEANSQTSTDWKTMLQNGSPIIDVRTPAEFANGHADSSINIPLNEIETRVKEIQEMDQPIVLCCASGVRSGRAMNFLRAQGIECDNAGSWENVQRQLRAGD